MPNDTEDTPQTFSIPAAGRILGYGRDAAYDAARSGRLPTLDLTGNGRNQRVTRATLDRLLEK
jgi:hypothetical protein